MPTDDDAPTLPEDLPIEYELALETDQDVANALAALLDNIGPPIGADIELPWTFYNPNEPLRVNVPPDNSLGLRISHTGQSMEVHADGRVIFTPAIENLDDQVKEFWRLIGLYASEKEANYHEEIIRLKETIEMLEGVINERQDIIGNLLKRIENLTNNSPPREGKLRFKAIVEEEHEDKYEGNTGGEGRRDSPPIQESVRLDSSESEGSGLLGQGNKKIQKK